MKTAILKHTHMRMLAYPFSLIAVVTDFVARRDIWHDLVILLGMILTIEALLLLFVRIKHTKSRWRISACLILLSSMLFTIWQFKQLGAAASVDAVGKLKLLHPDVQIRHGLVHWWNESRSFWFLTALSFSIPALLFLKPVGNKNMVQSPTT